MHSPAHTGVHSLAASVQKSHVHINAQDRRRAALLLPSKVSMVLCFIERSDITFPFIILSIPLIRNCANHLKVTGIKPTSVKTFASDGSR